ncbi:glutathione_peroxidase [Hexamita inflata]|uniref:Glutathione peroxidase n=1 Tax=Hexamita inflata TaxID=28002 RepID=A0AA86P5A6_9EUKA|nr:glutathione peroxidase [Hexamita inflata]
MSIYDFKTKTLDEQDFDMSQLQDKVVLIVNVASKCGFTKQYKGLQKLYKKHSEKGLVILGFPCNQFAHQEPDKATIQKCKENFGVTFPILNKIEVNGSGADPIYRYLKKQKRGVFCSQRIKWNFTKFLIDKNGVVIKRFSPTVDPEDLEHEIVMLL